MRALTVWPEWAWAICFLMKDVENRSWQAPETSWGHRLAIHAGMAIGGRFRAESRSQEIWGALEPLIQMASRAGYCCERVNEEGSGRPSAIRFGIPGVDASLRVMNIQHMARGAVVAVPILERSCWLEHGDGRYVNGPVASKWSADGQFGWILGDTIVLSYPVRCRGAQGLWSLLPSEEVSVRRQYENVK